LRALDRVVAVSSPTTIFPLPQAELPKTSGLLNGATSTHSATTNPASGLGSDESLGGALLTPIPWLDKHKEDEDRRGSGTSGTGSLGASPTRARDANGKGAELKSEKMEMVDGPNGAGRIETVTVVNGVLQTSSGPSAASSSQASGPPSAVTQDTSSTSAVTQDATGPTPTLSMEAELREAGAVTQGELLRQEQEAGVVPVATPNPRVLRSSTAASAAATAAAAGLSTDANQMDIDEDTTASVEEHPYARGPENIGAEDIGNQTETKLAPGGGLDMEAAVGRKLSPELPRERVRNLAEKADSEAQREGKDDEDWEKIEMDVEMGDADDEHTVDKGKGKAAASGEDESK